MVTELTGHWEDPSPFTLAYPERGAEGICRRLTLTDPASHLVSFVSRGRVVYRRGENPIQLVLMRWGDRRGRLLSRGGPAFGTEDDFREARIGGT